MAHQMAQHPHGERLQRDDLLAPVQEIEAGGNPELAEAPSRAVEASRSRPGGDVRVLHHGQPIRECFGEARRFRPEPACLAIPLFLHLLN